MLSRITRPVDPRFENAMLVAFGSVSENGSTGELENDDHLYKYNYKPGTYTTHRRTARCPKCTTVAPHRVDQVLAPGKGSILECVWCWGMFSTLGNCR
jgi:hypothetical protein